MDLRRAPVGVLLGQAVNQCAKFRRDRRPAAPRPRFPSPVEGEAARCNPTTVSGLTITSTARQRDQVARRTVQNSRSQGLNRSWLLPFQDGYLVSKREDFDSNIGTALQKDTSDGN